MTKRTDWENQLEAAILFNRNRPFEWGKHDCALFACNTIQDMTGLDLAAGLRGTYSSALQAARVIRSFGGDLETLAETRCNENDMPEIATTHASRGDVVIVINEGNKALGIVAMDARFALCAGKDGLTRVPRKDWLRAWRIT